MGGGRERERVTEGEIGKERIMTIDVELKNEINKAGKVEDS